VLGAVDILIELGVNRILTSSQAPTVLEGIPMLKNMIAHAAGG